MSNVQRFILGATLLALSFLTIHNSIAIHTPKAVEVSIEGGSPFPVATICDSYKYGEPIIHCVIDDEVD